MYWFQYILQPEDFCAWELVINTKTFHLFVKTGKYILFIQLFHLELINQSAPSNLISLFLQLKGFVTKPLKQFHFE